ncbi:MAG: SMP-30/gluconolactonase/LRE family protein [Planctomycetota bacterium]|nr:SMP-30/gluconolactonase/LRE family protein [Planctomycetota bacterium]
MSVTVLGLTLCMGGCGASRFEPRLVADLPGYSEGIVLDANGSHFASTLHRESVFIIRGTSPPAVWYHAPEPNGHKVLPDGTHLLAAKGGLHHIDETGTLIEVLTPQLATPNDLALDGDGGVYISVPAESEQQRDGMQSGVYYLDSTGSVTKVAGEFCYPNGIVVRPDGRTLLVNDSCTRQIVEFQITAPGVLSGRRVWAQLPDAKSVPDGMTLDQAGRIYMADYGTGDIVVFDHAGKVVRRYPTGLDHPSNVAFGGPALNDLYVTGSRNAEDGLGQLLVLPLGITGRSSLTLPAPILTR